jgi:hypothetical protein
VPHLLLLLNIYNTANNPDKANIASNPGTAGVDIGVCVGTGDEETEGVDVGAGVVVTGVEVGEVGVTSLQSPFHL